MRMPCSRTPRAALRCRNPWSNRMTALLRQPCAPHVRRRLGRPQVRWLIGVGHANNTALHLAECRALGAMAPRIRDGAPLLVDGRRRWVEYSHIDFDESDFVMLGDAYSVAGGAETRASLGAAEIRRLPMPEFVNFATAWIAEHRLHPL